jgi:hypothetical protein
VSGLGGFHCCKPLSGLRRLAWHKRWPTLRRRQHGVLLSFLSRTAGPSLNSIDGSDMQSRLPVFPSVRPLQEQIIQRSRFMFLHITVYLRPDCKHNEVRTYTFPGNCSRRRNETKNNARRTEDMCRTLGRPVALTTLALRGRNQLNAAYRRALASYRLSSLLRTTLRTNRSVLSEALT